ncbi:SIS domain-containing protein [Streptomyces sp. S6]|nr:SIS domain-containing protein [Streptomyces sp. S6]
MTHVARELASQPDCWQRAADLADGAAGQLPAAGERIAVVGCGTSYFMAQAYAALREGSGQGETDAFAASEFPVGRRYDRIVALSRSGTTTEVLGLLAQLRGTTRRTVVIGDPDSPMATTADDAVVLGFADEKSVVQTRFATTALTLLRAQLGLHTDAVVEDAQVALAEPLPAGLVECSQFTFLGRGWSVGLANEAALKMREAALAWMLGDAPTGLSDEVHATGARWVAGGLDPLAELVRVQRLALAIAASRGLDPDRPRHLTRSVILSTS